MQPVKMSDAERAEWVGERHSEGWKTATLDNAPVWKCRDGHGTWRYGVTEHAARIRAKSLTRN